MNRGGLVDSVTGPRIASRIARYPMRSVVRLARKTHKKRQCISLKSQLHNENHHHSRDGISEGQSWPENYPFQDQDKDSGFSRQLAPKNEDEFSIHTSFIPSLSIESDERLLFILIWTQKLYSISCNTDAKYTVHWHISANGWYSFKLYQPKLFEVI